MAKSIWGKFFVNVEWWLVKANSLTKGYAHYARAPREAKCHVICNQIPLLCTLRQASIYRAYLCNYIYYVYLITQI